MSASGTIAPIAAIPDGFGWEAFFGLRPAPQLEEATRLYRYDAIFVLDPLDTFGDPDDIVWAKDREIRRVHELIVQGYYDAGYESVFVPPDSATARTHRGVYIGRHTACACPVTQNRRITPCKCRCIDNPVLNALTRAIASWRYTDTDPLS